MDGFDLPAHSRRRHGPVCLSALSAARVSRAGRALRKFPSAARHHLDRADVLAVRDHRRVAQRQRQQHLHADRPDRARRSRVQKRHLDRRVRQAQTGRRPDPVRRGHRSVPSASAADLDDEHRVHRRRFSARRRHGRGRGNAAGDGHRRVLRHDRRDAVRIISHAGVLRHADETRLEEKNGDNSEGKKHFARLQRRRDGHRDHRIAVHDCFCASQLVNRRTGLQNAKQFRSGKLQSRRTRPLERRPSARQRAEGRLVGNFRRHPSERARSAGARVESTTQSRRRARGRGARHRPRRARRFIAEFEF